MALVRLDQLRNVGPVLVELLYDRHLRQTLSNRLRHASFIGSMDSVRRICTRAQFEQIDHASLGALPWILVRNLSVNFLPYCPRILLYFLRGQYVYQSQTAPTTYCGLIRRVCQPQNHSVHVHPKTSTLRASDRLSRIRTSYAYLPYPAFDLLRLRLIGVLPCVLIVQSEKIRKKRRKQPHRCRLVYLPTTADPRLVQPCTLLLPPLGLQTVECHRPSVQFIVYF
ncbi:hypothetical protein EG68_07179 [Paragonimus skrjabini miyazakii]|uniref:Uncharacterized protein n=1 Tax=Paragonimus skrjabini miyazakii TaxID=59628 RepID=A0A8S9Y9M7_9TREM|nr:hypothetical protein EG68_07179 [Paragonimus skrjabini miyazakii]